MSMKINGNDGRAYYQLELPAAEELESITLKKAIKDIEIKKQFPQLVKAITDNPPQNKFQWDQETLMYFQKDVATGNIKISHFLPAIVREAYE